MEEQRNGFLRTQLHEFCATATIGRDKSHGVEHMDQVCKNAIEIWKKESTNHPSLDSDRILSLVIAAAQLHDVADHKYGQTITQLESVASELQKYFSNDDVRLLMMIMDQTSYSKEAKFRKATGISPSWDDLGVEGKVVRNIVSDADKLEAIGMIGVQRCLQYSYEVAISKNEKIGASDLFSHLVEHGEEKLFILKDEYIRTNAGKEMAESPHMAMLQEVARLNDLKEHDFPSFEREIMIHVRNSRIT
jgi:HD superfamily phosphodiesterase